jgi:hypothetical protein
MRRFVFASVIVLVFFAASMASAYTVQLAYTGVTDGAAVTLAGKLNGGYLAGNYNATIAGYDDSFSGFCVDWATANSLNSPSDYNLVGIADDSRYEAAAWVMENYNTQAYGYSAVAAQIAIWELVWDWDTRSSPSLTTGNLIYSGDTYYSTASALITAALTGMSTFDQSKYMIALSPDTGDSLGNGYQDFIFQRNDVPGNMVSAPVPIPPAAYLFSAGLIGLIGVRRRFQK